MLLAKKAIYLYKKVDNYSDVHARIVAAHTNTAFHVHDFLQKREWLKILSQQQSFNTSYNQLHKNYIYFKVYRKIRSVSIDQASNVEDDNNQSVTIFV